jgi:hypothetical protein
MVEVGQQLQIGRYLATGTEGLSLYADVRPSGQHLECPLCACVRLQQAGMNQNTPECVLWAPVAMPMLTCQCGVIGGRHSLRIGACTGHP